VAYNSSQILHRAIDEHDSWVPRERSHQADDIPPEESIEASLLVLLFEATPHVWVLEIAKSVGLHESLDVVERIVEHPVESSTYTASYQRNVNGNVMTAIGRSQVLGDSFDQGEIKTKACWLSDCCSTLTSVETSDTPLFEYLQTCINWASIDFISFSSLDLNSDPCVFDRTLNEVKITTKSDEIMPAPNAAKALSFKVNTAGTPSEPFQLAKLDLKFS